MLSIYYVCSTEKVSELSEHLSGRTRDIQSIVMFCKTIIVDIRFDVFTAVTMKNAVFWDVAPCRYCVDTHVLTLVHRSRIFIP
jgi:hypothetical protein